MAVIHQNDIGFLICHRKFSEEIYGKPYKSVLFDLRTPFLKDLEAQAEAKALECGLPRVRKRKRKKVTGEGNSLPLEESKVTSFLLQLSTFFMPKPTAADLHENNRPSRDAVAQLMSSPFAIQCQNVAVEQSAFTNSSDQVTQEEIFGQQFLLPPFSEFYKQNVEELSLLVNAGRRFSLVVIDPPWTNRFIKRKRTTEGKTGRYHSMSNEFLAQMPISSFCADNCLVAIWCTNSATHINELFNTLLPAWNLSYVATWYWIKVTTSGQFVCPWNGPSGKHPFERIILARHTSQGSSEEPPVIPDGRLVVSVPCAIHSFKPPLQRLLQPYIVTSGAEESLELFARSLLPSTVSWGNQLPLLQHVDLFEPADQEHN